MISWAIAAGVAGILFTILWIKCSEKKERFPKHYTHDNGRPVGPTEDFWRISHDRNGKFIIANALMLRSRKPINSTVVKKAMELLIKRHPMLRMQIRKNENGVYCFQKMEKVGVDMRQLDTKDWQNAMEESLLEKFDGENGPLWRVMFLPNARYESATGSDVQDMTYPNQCICIFGFHHIIMDGPSFSRLFAEFIDHLDKLNSNEEPEVSSMPWLPPFSVYVYEAVQPKWYHCLLVVALDILCLIPGFPAFVMGVMVGMSGEGNAFTRKHGIEVQRNPQIQPRTKIIPLEFTKDETSRLLKKCKENQTTVQGAVQTAGGVAMATMLQENECDIDCTVTVNVRRFFKSIVPNDYAGPYVTAIQCKNTFVTSFDQDKFWCMAKSISEDIHARLKTNEHMEMALISTYMAPVFSQYLSSSSTKRDNKHGERSKQLIVYTNLGCCKFLNRSPNDDVILRASFGCTAEHQQGCIFANNLATFNDQLFWTVVYYSNITSEATAQKYADLVKQAIFKATKG